MSQEKSIGQQHESTWRLTFDLKKRSVEFGGLPGRQIAGRKGEDAGGAFDPRPLQVFAGVQWIIDDRQSP